MVEEKDIKVEASDSTEIAPIKKRTFPAKKVQPKSEVVQEQAVEVKPLEAKPQYTGLQHSIAYNATPTKKVRKIDWEAERLRDREPVTGIFMFHEIPGGVLEFTYYKYKGDPVERYSLRDGQEYTLPRGVVDHLNNDCSRPIHEHAKDADGRPLMRIGYLEHRCSFRETYGQQIINAQPRVYRVEQY